jgi:hypothetical protein
MFEKGMATGEIGSGVPNFAVEATGMLLASVSHLGTLVSSAYKGAMNAQGYIVDPSTVILLAGVTTATTAALPPFFGSYKSSEIASFGSVGAALSGVEVIFGYGIGYAGGWLVDKILS